MVVELAGEFIKRGTRVYDLGCSTGTTLTELVRAHPDAGVELVDVDKSEAMLTATPPDAAE